VWDSVEGRLKGNDNNFKGEKEIGRVTYGPHRWEWMIKQTCLRILVGSGHRGIHLHEKLQRGEIQVTAKRGKDVLGTEGEGQTKKKGVRRKNRK